MRAPTEAAEVSQCLPEGRERRYIAFPRQSNGKGNFKTVPSKLARPVRAGVPLKWSFLRQVEGKGHREEAKTVRNLLFPCL